MGMAASQARFLGLTARKTNVEYEGQQINQARTALANQSANLFNQLLGLKVPTPPQVADFTKLVYGTQIMGRENVMTHIDPGTTPGYDYNVTLRTKINEYQASNLQKLNNAVLTEHVRTADEPFDYYINANGMVNTALYELDMNNLTEQDQVALDKIRATYFTTSERMSNNDSTTSYFYNNGIDKSIKFTKIEDGTEITWSTDNAPSTEQEYIIKCENSAENKKIVQDNTGKIKYFKWDTTTDDWGNFPTFDSTTNWPLDGTKEAHHNSTYNIITQDGAGRQNIKRYYANGDVLSASGDTIIDEWYRYTFNSQPVYINKADYIDYFQGLNSNDDQTARLQTYYTSYVDKYDETIHAANLITDPATGRYDQLQLEDGNWYLLTCGEEKDEEAYDAAMNNYVYEKAAYEKTIEDINSQTEIIQLQDRTLELRLKQLDTEQEAVQTEMDSVKKVIEKNIDATFKTFA